MQPLKLNVAWIGESDSLYAPSLLPDNFSVVQRFEDDHCSQWESILADSKIDLVLFAKSQQTDLSQSILRTLVQNQVPVAILSPDADSLFAYELEMIRVDAGGKLAALLPPETTSDFLPTTLHGHASIADSGTNAIYNHLTHDLLFLRSALGTPHYVFAMGGRLDNDIQNITVNIEFENGAILNWGRTGRTLNSTQFVQNTQSDVFDQTEFDQQDLGDQLEILLDADSSGSWVQYASMREASELISLSLKKGRRIEIFDGNPTEGDSFKGVMSTAGCFILLLVLFVISIFAVFDIAHMPETRDGHITALESGNPITESPKSTWLRLWPVYPLLLFLMFQFLRLVIRTESKPGQSG